MQQAFVPTEIPERNERDETVRLNCCAQFERLLVITRHSRYDVIVLRGEHGDVLVRGGHLFPSFRRARLDGSTAGGTALKLGSIDAGLHLELNIGGERITTSTILAVRRVGRFRRIGVGEPHESAAKRLRH
jgi:hypothetical protein